jgi:hypothetical protein
VFVGLVSDIHAWGRVRRPALRAQWVHACDLRFLVCCCYVSFSGHAKGGAMLCSACQPSRCSWSSWACTRCVSRVGSDVMASAPVWRQRLSVWLCRVLTRVQHNPHSLACCPRLPKHGVRPACLFLASTSFVLLRHPSWLPFAHNTTHTLSPTFSNCKHACVLFCWLYGTTRCPPHSLHRALRMGQGCLHSTKDSH